MFDGSVERIIYTHPVFLAVSQRQDSLYVPAEFASVEWLLSWGTSLHPEMKKNVNAYMNAVNQNYELYIILHPSEDVGHYLYTYVPVALSLCE